MKFIAKGNTAEIFDYGADKVCKLFYPGYPFETVHVEFQHATLLQNMNLPVPICYEYVCINNRYGIVYEKIRGTNLINKLTDPAQYKKIVQIIVSTHKKFLKHEHSMIPSYKEFIRNTVSNQEVDVLKKLKELPEGNHLCHGDFHPGNIMIDENGQIKVIDFMNLCRGPKEYDIARTYYLIGFSKLPKEIEFTKDFQVLRKRLAEDYLQEMDIPLNNIAPFLPLIEICHMYETSK